MAAPAWGESWTFPLSLVIMSISDSNERQWTLWPL